MSTYRDDFVQTVKEILIHGKTQGAEQISFTWQQFAGREGPLNHTITITYRRAAEHGIVADVDPSDTPFMDKYLGPDEAEKSS